MKVEERTLKVSGRRVSGEEGRRWSEGASCLALFLLPEKLNLSFLVGVYTASTSTSKPTKSKKPKPTVKAPTPPPAPPPPLPPTILNLIKSYLSPLDLRSHLAFSGTSKHIRKTCYGSEQAWKEIVLGAGFGKPSSVRTGGGGEGGEWKEVARKLVNCLAYGFGERGTLDDGWEGFRREWK